MSNSIVAGVYRHVIDEVISTVQKDFEDMGVDESILQELQRSWETKIANARVANFVVSEPQVPEGYTNAYYDETGNPVQYTEQYAHAPPPTEGQEYAYAEQYQQQQSHGVAAANLATLASASSALKQDNGVGAPQTYMPPRPEEQTQIPQQAAASYYNTIMLPSGSNGEQNSNHNIPQTDGSSDMSTQEIDALIASRALAKSSRKIPQVDGEDDDDEDEDEDEEGEEDVEEAEPVVDSEDAINSDLDDTDDDDRGEDGGEEMEHIVLCQYDKVTRTKNKWKCVLKDGIMLVNGKDYLFHKVNGDFEW